MGPWRLVCSLRSAVCWNWPAVSEDPAPLRQWLNSAPLIQILWRGASGGLSWAVLGPPDLLFGKAGVMGSSGAILRSCAVCIITDPLATGMALGLGSLRLHYAAWRFRVLLWNHRTFSAVQGLFCACLLFFNMTRVIAIWNKWENHITTAFHADKGQPKW